MRLPEEPVVFLVLDRVEAAVVADALDAYSRTHIGPAQEIVNKAHASLLWDLA